MKLSLRLLTLANMIEKHCKGTILADIGTDHGYLPCYLVDKQIVDKAYACDVSKGPFESSLSTIRGYNKSDSVMALLGDGLDPILDKEVDMISIAGMGAYLMSEILDKNISYIKDQVLFLQPNANVDHLRQYLYNHGFDIIDEAIMQEGYHVYEMMCVVKKENTVYDKNDIIFGPVLRKEKNDIFMSYWNKQYRTFQNIIKDLPKEHERYIELSSMMKRIEEIL